MADAAAAAAAPADALTASTTDAMRGLGAWDCDAGRAIPPEKEAEVFEEIPTMDFPFHGMPTVPPRKDMSHMAFFCRGVRYRVTAFPDWTAARVKAALWAGGLGRGSGAASAAAAAPGGGGRSGAARRPGAASLPPPPPSPHPPPTHPPPSGPADYSLVYAGRVIPDGATLGECGVPPGCQALVAVETARLGAPPSPTSPFWD